MSRSHKARWLAGAAVALLTVACSENVLAPFSPEISNQTDSFQFQATGLIDVTELVQYTWQNTGTTANVDQSSAVTSGSAHLEILDADGTQVYRDNLDNGGSFTTVAGTSGAWTIRVELSSTDGTLNFRVQKP